MDISKYIYELILTSECIVLPGFGGFETQYHPASIDPLTKKITPPTKNITFNISLKRGQGVVNNYIAQKLDVDNEQAAIYIAGFIENLYNSIEKNNSAYLDGIGTLFLDEEGEITFKEEKKENHLADSFGLGTIPIKMKKQPEPSNKEVEEMLKPIHQVRQNTGAYVVIGVLVVLILFTLVFIIQTKFDLKVFPFSLFDKPAPKHEMIVIGNDTDIAADDTANYIEQQLRQSTELKQALLFVDDEGTTGQLVYYMVAGSFKNIDNAIELQNELIGLGYRASVIEKGSLHRVVLTSYTDRDKAFADLKKMQQLLDKNIWLMKTGKVN